MVLFDQQLQYIGYSKGARQVRGVNLGRCIPQTAITNLGCFSWFCWRKFLRTAKTDSCRNEQVRFVSVKAERPLPSRHMITSRDNVMPDPLPQARGPSHGGAPRRRRRPDSRRPSRLRRAQPKKENVCTFQQNTEFFCHGLSNVKTAKNEIRNPVEMRFQRPFSIVNEGEPL